MRAWATSTPQLRPRPEKGEPSSVPDGTLHVVGARSHNGVGAWSGCLSSAPWPWGLREQWPGGGNAFNGPGMSPGDDAGGDAYAGSSTDDGGGFGGGGDSEPGLPGRSVVTPPNPSVTVTITDGGCQRAPSSSRRRAAARPSPPCGSVDQGAIGSSTKAAGSSHPRASPAAPRRSPPHLGGATGSTTVTVVIQGHAERVRGDDRPDRRRGLRGRRQRKARGARHHEHQEMALQRTPTADPARTFLYPYDKTVWPRGLLAPLLQWTQGASDATAIAIHLQSLTFIYDGYFGRPAALGTSRCRPPPDSAGRLASGHREHGRNRSPRGERHLPRGRRRRRADHRDMDRRARRAPGHGVLRVVRHRAHA